MKILFKLEPNERAFLKALLERGGTYSNGHPDQAFRETWKTEIVIFNDNELVACINPDSNGALQQYGLTAIGKKAAE